MPRQLRVSELKTLTRQRLSPAKTKERPVYLAKCKESGGVAGSAPATIKNLHNVLNSVGIAQEADRGMSAMNMSLSLLNASGIGVAHRVGNSGAAFSLQQQDTDNTIIPNAKITDLKTIDKKSLGSKLIKATDKFPNPELNPFYVPDQCPPVHSIALQQTLDKKRLPNTISIAKDFAQLQKRLPAKLMLPEFKIIYGKQ